MADLRYDPISGVWVAMARKRRERPMEFIPIEQIHQQIICPFCRGNEEETPAPIRSYGGNGAILGPNDDPTSWLSRIVPNKFPSLIGESGHSECGPYSCTCSDGVQELVIPTSRHVSSLSELTSDELQVCWHACQQRVAEIQQMPEIEHVMLFLNSRSAAGASLEHIHFQLMGAPVLSPYMVGRIQRDDENRKIKNESLIATLLNWELAEEVRIVKETENFVLLCPFASRFSFQVWIVPKNASLTFANEPLDFRSELSELCTTYIQRLEQLLDNPAYNLLVNLAPSKRTTSDHWFIEIFPRLNRMAGFEIGTDIWVNPVPPEAAARRLSN